jgi:hypothetical protein
VHGGDLRPGSELRRRLGRTHKAEGDHEHGEGHDGEVPSSRWLSETVETSNLHIYTYFKMTKAN